MQYFIEILRLNKANQIKNYEISKNLKFTNCLFYVFKL